MTTTVRQFINVEGVQTEITNWNVTDSCSCSVCVAIRANAPRHATADGVTTIAAPQPEPVLTKRERDILLLTERGIGVIPDDEVTDMGDYVIWNKPDMTKVLLFRTMSDIVNNYNTMRQEMEWYGYTEATITGRRLMAYPGKPVRLNGWFQIEGDTTAFYGFKAGQRQTRMLVTPGYYNDETVHGHQDMARLKAVDGRPAMSRETRLKYMSALLNRIYNRSPSAYTYERHIRTSANLVRLQSSARGGAPAFEPVVSRMFVAPHLYSHAKATMKEIGGMIANPDDYTNEEFVEAIGNLPDYLASGRRNDLVNFWNERNTGDEDLVVAQCGHIVPVSEITPTNDGDTCDDCVDSHYAQPEDSDTYYRRSQLYLHSDDCYYTYREYDEDDDDDDDSGSYQSSNSVGGRVRGYSDNVLNYASIDESIKVSTFGEVLMGIELEVVPNRKPRDEAVKDTVNNLCDEYAILKNDGSLKDGGFEIVTAPRGLKEHIQRFTDWTPHSTLRSWDPGCCGMHVHMSAGAFSQATLGKFIEFINAEANDDLIIAIAGRHPKMGGNAAEYCQRDSMPSAMGNPKKAVQYKNVDRYRMINTANLSTTECKRLGIDRDGCNGKNINTIELRIFRGTLNKPRLLAQIEFAHAALMFCRATSMRELRGKHFIAWLRQAAGLYPNLARWFGVRANSSEVVESPKAREAAEV